MKLSRALALGTVAVIGLGSSLLLSSAASAAAPINYVTASQLGTPGGQGWFSAGGGTVTSTAAGLSVGDDDLLNEVVPDLDLEQFAYPTLHSPAGRLEVEATGTYRLELPLSVEVDGVVIDQDTVIEAVSTGATNNSTDQWRVTDDVVDAANAVILGSGATYTLGQIQSILDASSAVSDYTVLAYGISVPAGQTASIHSIRFNGQTTLFTPQPTSTLSTNSISVTQSTSTGLRATFTGFVPGEGVSFLVDSGHSADIVMTAVTADSAGIAVLDYVAGFPLDVGAWTINATAGPRQATAAFTVTADVAATPITDPGNTTAAVDPAVPTLANTGVDSLSYSLVGGALLLVGLGFGAVAQRRRRVG